MSVDDRSEKFCIVGAGSSGLAALKALTAAGIPCDCLEREDDVGGNWYYGRPHSSVYASTHTISSKRLTEYVDYPMPDALPEYPRRFPIVAVALAGLAGVLAVAIVTLVLVLGR